MDNSFATGNGHYYTVRDDMWLSVVPDHSGALGLDYLQKRLGRDLVDDDFVATPDEIFQRIFPPELRDGTFAQGLDDAWRKQADEQLRARIYYEEDGITIIHGDTGEILPFLPPVDVVIADAPYSEHVHAKNRRGARANSSEITTKREVDFAPLALRALESVGRAISPTSLGAGAGLLGYRVVPPLARCVDHH